MNNQFGGHEGMIATNPSVPQGLVGTADAQDVREKPLYTLKRRSGYGDELHTHSMLRTVRHILINSTPKPGLSVRIISPFSTERKANS